MAILKTCVTKYKDEAVQYKGQVYDKVLKEIAESVFQKLFQCFNAQVKLQRNKALDEFESKMKKAVSKRDVVNDHFHRDTKNMKQEQMGTFKKNSANLIIENSGWGENVQQHIDEIDLMLEKITKVAREKEIEKLQSLTKKAFYDTAEEIINDPIYTLKDSFWPSINDPLHQELCLVIENCL